jgi:splicing factor 3B subunit 3
VLDLVAINEHE